MKKLSHHHVALAVIAVIVAATVYFAWPNASPLSADPSSQREDHPGQLSKAGGSPTSKGIDSEPGTDIHPVVQDNGNKEAKDGVKQTEQEDYHQSQAN